MEKLPPQEPISSPGVKWNKVTWYSQLAAILLGILIFFIGFYVGSRSRSEDLRIEKKDTHYDALKYEQIFENIISSIVLESE